MGEQIRPGWYARTPDGKTESWWDGEHWTGATRPTPGTEPPYEETAKERIARRMVYGGLAAIAAVVVITVAAVALDDDGDGGERNEPDVGMTDSEARYVCEQFVKDRLKSPGTADFQAPDVSALTNGRWQVEGAVDSENGFGALIRSTYSCVVRDSGDGSASLLELDVS